MNSARRQNQRLLWQAGFFVLFILAPIFNLFRFDLIQGHAWLLGMPWRLGLDGFLAGRIPPLSAGLNLILRLFLPILGGGGLFILAAWRWGRLYCGWLCPHFSVVEAVNSLMRRASGKQSVWGKPPPLAKNGLLRQANGSFLKPDRRWWLATVPAALGFGFLWAVVLLTYLMPPLQVYSHLFHGTLTRAEALFIGAGTVVLTLEFLFARHLFCRFACAVGLFQSLAWMGNRSALVIGFQRKRASDCTACREEGGTGYYACEQVCPMQLKPRSVKQAMFTCTQCAQCVSACDGVQTGKTFRNRPEDGSHARFPSPPSPLPLPGEGRVASRYAAFTGSGKGSLLTWVQGEAARQNEATMSLTGKRD
jgi:polyferredoxin